MLILTEKLGLTQKGKSNSVAIPHGHEMAENRLMNPNPYDTSDRARGLNILF